MTGLNDLDWNEIKEKYNIKAHYDTVRKASQTIFGGAFVSEYLKWKGVINSSSTTKISQAKELIGEQFLLKKQLQNDKSQINKFKTEFVKSISIAEELAAIQEKNGFTVNVPEYCHVELDEIGEYKMIVHITDWHIGYIIENCKGNYYNWEIANNRVNKLISECRRYIELYDVKNIYVINTGDMIEHISMRKNQSQFCEFNQAQQINHAIEIIFRLLVALCEKCNVEYDSIYGNHDRTNGDYSANLDGDNADTIICEQIKKYKELSNLVRLTVIDRPHTDKEIVKMVNGLSIKAKHGDKGAKDDKTDLKNDISMDEEFYQILLKGHEHNHRVISENKGRYIVSGGCLSGYNDYSTNFGCATVASQTIIITKPNEIELIKDVQLN
jgi:predicted phosphodiesterase